MKIEIIASIFEGPEHLFEAELSVEQSATWKSMRERERHMFVQALICNELEFTYKAIENEPLPTQG